MKSRSKHLAFFVLAAALVLAACGPAAPASLEVPPEASDAGEIVPLAPPMPTAMPSAMSLKSGEEMAAAGEDEGAGVNMDTLAAAYQTDRMIIKNAEIRLQVEDTDVAIDRTTQVVADVGGYIISQRVWYQDWLGESYKYTTITLGVPVNQFERALRRLRELSLKVLDENASGEDVTDQFVDLESQLANLEATRDRIRTFLDQAQTVDEALRVNQQLSEVERQIEEIKGRMNYLTDRSAFSTITINIEPKLPDPPTPTPTPTFTPTPTPQPWSLKPAFDSATGTLTTAYHGIAEFLVWLLLVFVPVFGPFVLIAWGIFRLLTRKKTPPPPSAG
ncbi:MAG: DUF4349 domain-containing protein [Chloroflexota bacterium]